MFAGDLLFNTIVPAMPPGTNTANWVQALERLEALGVEHAIAFVPTTWSTPLGITRGPDNNVWFTENAGNKIGRVTENWVFTEFPIPTADSQPLGITSDGTNLWFTESAGNKIGMITPTGQITEYKIPAANSQPDGISADAQGNIWFTESAGNKIGELITQGGQICVQIGKLYQCGIFKDKILEFAIPTPDSHPTGLTYDWQDYGGFWFTEEGADKIGHISGNTVTEVVLPTGSAPNDIDNLTYPCFTEFTGNAIGCLDIY